MGAMRVVVAAARVAAGEVVVGHWCQYCSGAPAASAASAAAAAAGGGEGSAATAGSRR